MGSGYRVFTAGEVLTASNVQDYLQNQSVMSFADSTARATSIGTANFEEGMVSYLQDSDTLEVYDGSTWGSIAPATTQGLTLINTTSFSGVASQSLNNVFSATYDNYRIVCYLETTSIANLGIRLRVAGVDNSTASSYINQLINGASSGVTAQRLVSSQWSEFIYINASSEINSFIFDLQKPFLATQTAGQQQGGRDNNLTIGQLRHNQSTSYDGFTMIPSSGNITGKVSVYGYSL